VKAAALFVIAACSRREPIEGCDGDLRGVYVDKADAASRWMILDHGPTLEVYPLFPDGAKPGPASAAGPASGDAAATEVAPRVIDFERAIGTPTIDGTLRRRYQRGADLCDAHVPVHLTSCAGDVLQLVIADPAPPIRWAPCAWPGPGPSRVVRWRRE